MLIPLRVDFWKDVNKLWVAKWDQVGSKIVLKIDLGGVLGVLGPRPETWTWWLCFEKTIFYWKKSTSKLTSVCAQILVHICVGRAARFPRLSIARPLAPLGSYSNTWRAPQAIAKVWCPNIMGDVAQVTIEQTASVTSRGLVVSTPIRVHHAATWTAAVLRIRITIDHPQGKVTYSERIFLSKKASVT